MSRIDVEDLFLIIMYVPSFEHFFSPVFRTPSPPSPPPGSPFGTDHLIMCEAFLHVEDRY